MYKGVLFIDINSNAYAAGSDTSHVNYVRDVINRYGDDAKWTTLVYHHSIYSPADHANDRDNQQRRFDFTRSFSDMGVDLSCRVTTTPTRAATRSRTARRPTSTSSLLLPRSSPAPGGVIYMTANSASGSKYYLPAPRTPPRATARTRSTPPASVTSPNSIENQEHVRSFVKVSVTDDKLAVENIRASDCTTLNRRCSRQRQHCGVTSSRRHGDRLRSVRRSTSSTCTPRCRRRPPRSPRRPPSRPTAPPSRPRSPRPSPVASAPSRAP